MVVVAVKNSNSQTKFKLKKKTCPRCGEPGYGPYVKETRNRRGGQVYRKYLYFMHKVDLNGSVKTVWCYIGKPLARRTFEPKLPNQEKLPNHLPNQLPNQVQEKLKTITREAENNEIREAKYLKYLENLVRKQENEEVT